MENFLHVFELGSLSQASHRAHLTQPALSRQIQVLEEQLGCALFERTGRGMRPTEEGERLAARARPLVAQILSLETEFSTPRVAGPLTVAVTPSAGMAWMADVTKRFCLTYPEVELRVVVALSGAMGEAISLGKFDVGILYSPLSDSALHTARLWEEATYFVCRRDHPLARCSGISLKNVLQSELILPSSQFGLRALLEEKSRALSLPVQMKIEIDSVQLAIELVKAGVGAMVLTERSLPDIRARKLVAMPIRRPQLMRSAELAAREASLSRPAVRAFWDFLLAQKSAG